MAWRFFDDAMVESPDFEGEFLLAEGGERLPLTYTLQAVKEPDRDLVRSRADPVPPSSGPARRGKYKRSCS